MIALFFEVCPHPGHEQAYLDLAQRLRPELDRSGGLAAIDRFRSLARPGWMLSHQYWKDEASLVRWRQHAGHHGVQIAGRTRHFADYRLRVGAVIAEAAAASRITRMTEPSRVASAGPGQRATRHVVAIAAEGRPFEGEGLEAYESVYTAGTFVSVASPASEAAAHALLERAAAVPRVRLARAALVLRDYGMHERAEAPQEMPPVGSS